MARAAPAYRWPLPAGFGRVPFPAREKGAPVYGVACPAYAWRGFRTLHCVACRRGPAPWAAANGSPSSGGLSANGPPAGEVYPFAPNCGAQGHPPGSCSGPCLEGRAKGESVPFGRHLGQAGLGTAYRPCSPLSGCLFADGWTGRPAGKRAVFGTAAHSVRAAGVRWLCPCPLQDRCAPPRARLPAVFPIPIAFTLFHI